MVLARDWHHLCRPSLLLSRSRFSTRVFSPPLAWLTQSRSFLEAQSWQRRSPSAMSLERLMDFALHCPWYEAFCHLILVQHIEHICSYFLHYYGALAGRHCPAGRKYNTIDPGSFCCQSKVRTTYAFGEDILFGLVDLIQYFTDHIAVSFQVLELIHSNDIDHYDLTNKFHALHTRH